MTAANRTVSRDPVLFWAELDPAALWRGVALALLFMLPLAFLAPAGFLAAGGASLLLRAWNQRNFRFHLSRNELRVKASFFLPELRLPLKDIASVGVLPDSAGGFLPLAPRSGHLVIARTDGGQIIVPGIKDAAEAAEAVERLKREAVADRTERAAA
jgi:hypothetical protein